ADLRIQRQLAAAAGEWAAAGQDVSFLAQGARLAQFATLATGSTVALTAEERVYLDAGVRAREQQAQAERERVAHELDLAHQATTAAQQAATAAEQAAAAAQRAATAERSAAGRLRGLVGGLAVFLLVAAGLAAFAF